MYCSYVYGWEVMSRTEQRRNTRQHSYGNSRVENEEVTGLLPITTYFTNNAVRIDGVGKDEVIYPKQNLLWTDGIEVKVEGNIDVLVTSLEQDNILIMSDGSVNNGIGTAGWIITTEVSYQQDSYIWGKGTVPEDVCDSHRTECFGILGGIATWKKYKQIWEIKNSKPLQLMCDNKSAINYACDTSRYHYITSKIPDFDVIGAIRYLLRICI
jgi:hypothetical protein